MHLCMKIPRHTSKNPIAAGDFTWIFARNCEGTEQLPEKKRKGISGSRWNSCASPLLYSQILNAFSGTEETAATGEF